jgi:hypothetical protein
VTASGTKGIHELESSNRIGKHKKLDMIVGIPKNLYRQPVHTKVYNFNREEFS